MLQALVQRYEPARCDEITRSHPDEVHSAGEAVHHHFQQTGLRLPIWEPDVRRFSSRWPRTGVGLAYLRCCSPCSTVSGIGPPLRQTSSSTGDREVITSPMSVTG